MGSVIPMTITAVPFCYNWFRILKLVALTLPVSAPDDNGRTLLLQRKCTAALRRMHSLHKLSVTHKHFTQLTWCQKASHGA